MLLNLRYFIYIIQISQIQKLYYYLLCHIYANSQEKVKLWLIAVNRCYFGLLPLLKTKLISRKFKVTLYKALVKSDEKKLEVFERKILRNIFGPKRNYEREY
jgi:hypothetical protein